MKQQQLPEATEPTALERVRFKDGMVVNADDLHDAMTYPVDVLRTLARAYFGCGIVCGLEVKHKEDTNFTIEVKKGVALDCYGYPLELCGSVSLDLKHDKCAESDTVYIAIRRVTTDELPRPASDCAGEAREPEYQCTRVQEHVQIKVFAKDNLPKTICMHAEAEELEEEESDEECEREEGGADAMGAAQDGLDLCACLTVCEDEACCDDAWVLLACV
ncbi:MAG: hypothetical protein WA970_03585, partial [Gammaproteobacteria bacterium]